MHRLTLSAGLLATLAAGCVRGSRAPELGAAAAAATSPSCSTVTDLVIAATTDVHGRLRAWDYYANAPEAVRGLSRAATVIDSVRAANPSRVVLVDAGDLLQGNPLAYVAARVSSDTTSPVVAAMNAMRYDAAAVGNHEYNYGLALLERAVGQASFPFLSANTYRVGAERVFPAFRIVERAGVKVGVVGATTPGVAVWDRDNVAGRLEFRDIVPSVREAVGEARRAGAEVIVVVLHSGLDEPSSYDTVTTGVPSENVSARVAREVEGIDLLVFGHSHKELANKFEGTTLLLQPKNWATSIGVAHLPVGGCEGQQRVGRGATSAIVQAAGHAEDAAVLAATERAHRETVAYATTPIGATPVAWRGDSARVVDTPLIDFILEVQRNAAGADLASTAAFSLDAKLDAGPITVAQLARLYPYDNTLRAVRISGRQLREYLEHSSRYYRTYVAGPAGPVVDPEVPGYNFDIVSGAEYVLDLSKPLGSRVTSLSVKGRRVVPGDSFTMALNNYRQTGGGGFAMLHGAPVVYDKQQEIRQLLIDEVRRRKTIRPQDYFHPNWRLEPAGAVRAAYEGARASDGAPRARETTPSTAAGAAGGAPPPGVLPDSAAAAASQSPTPAPDRATAPAPGRVRLRVVATNDFHGALEPRKDSRGTLQGGAAAVATAIAQARRECGAGCETIVVDAGDMFQGTPVSNLAFGRPVLDVYNTVGYAAAALGNHEFDWGQDTLRALMRGARFPILGANVRYTDGRDVEWVPNDTVMRLGRLSVGLIGVADPATPRTTRPVNLVGLRFDDPVPIVDSIARVMRSRGVDVVLVLAHFGAFCDASGAAKCDGTVTTFAQRLTARVDGVVSGHTHSLVDVAVRGTPIVQARWGARAIAVLDLDVRPGGKAPSIARAEVRPVTTASYPADPRVDAIVRAAVAAVWPRISQPVGAIADEMPRTGEQYALGNLVTDAQRWAGKSDIAIMNNSGMRAGLAAGMATYGSLYEVQPFGNALHVMTARGRAVREFLERRIATEIDDHVSGVVVRFDPRRPAGSRIVSLTTSDGRPFDDGATYTIVMNDFIATGRDGLELSRTASRTAVLDMLDLDALIAFIRAQKAPVKASTEIRIRADSTGAATR